MYAVSDAFLSTIRQSSKRKTVVDLYYGTNTDPIISDLPVVDGSIDYDRNSATRAKGQVVIGDPTLLPNLEPYGMELVIRSGVVYPNGQEELVPMGTFMIDVESFEEADGKIPAIDFYDRAQRVGEYEVALGFAGMRVGDALNYLILQPAPGWDRTPSAPLWSLTFDDSLNQSQKLPGGFYNGETDRWAVIEKLTDMMAAELFFNRDGNAICQPAPVITTATTTADSVWVVDADQGNSTGSMIKASKKISRENTYNGVLVRGASPAVSSSTKTQVFAVVYDLDPNSRTYWLGPFGKKRYDTSNQALTTKTQCKAAAGKLLKKFAGLSKAADFTALVNPALDVGDIITIQDMEGLEEVFMVETLHIPFGAGEMTGTCSSKQYVSA